MSATHPEPPVAGQRGFSLITAIFLLVILAALGVFMMSLSTLQQTSSALDLQGSRAYQAARAGIDWSVYQVMAPENINPPAGGVAQYVCPATATVLPALGGTLNNFSITLACTSQQFSVGGNLLTVYQLTSTARFGAAPATSFIERATAASVNTCRTSANGAPC